MIEQPSWVTQEIIDNYKLREDDRFPEIPEGWEFDGMRNLTPEDFGALFISMGCLSKFRPFEEGDSWMIEKTMKRVVLKRSGWMPLNKRKTRRWTDHVDDDGAALVSGWSVSNGGKIGYTSNTVVWEKCKHPGTKPIDVGKYKGLVHLAAQYDISKALVGAVHVVCPLNGSMPRDIPWGSLVPVMWCELQDRGGVPKEWPEFINNIIKYLDQGYKVLAYCMGSHGRTGTFGASLISVLEPETEDPIAAIRKRHCKEAVESRAQAEAIFALRGQKLPEKYEKEFKVYTPTVTTTTTTTTTTTATAATTTTTTSKGWPAHWHKDDKDKGLTEGDLNFMGEWPHGFN